MALIDLITDEGSIVGLTGPEINADGSNDAVFKRAVSS
jgi:hypothetical protein